MVAKSWSVQHIFLKNLSNQIFPQSRYSGDMGSQQQTELEQDIKPTPQSEVNTAAQRRHQGHWGDGW